ncbi:MAG: type II secretion system major pseudopilin GspG [Planctomycetaceae bacterium]
MKRRRTVRRGGFTLLEVLLVLAILGVIAAIVVPQLLGRQKEANIKATQASIIGLEQALKLYASDHYGEYPAGGDETLLTLTQPEQLPDGRVRDPYLEEIPKDAWDQPLHYQYQSGQSMLRPQIWSSGPDMQNNDGSGDDITNVEDLEV